MNLTIKPITPKFNILYRKSRYKVLYGGRSSGKSWAIVEALIYYAIKYKVRILCAREVQKSIKDSAYQLIIDTINRYGISHHFVILKNVITCTLTGSTFIFHGLSTTTEQSVKSMEGIDIAWLEEAQVISQQSLDLLIPTIRKSGSEVWFSFNPGLPSDPVSQMFLSGQLPPETLIEKVNYTDNPKVSKETLRDAEFAKSTDIDLYYHIWEGAFMSEGDNLFIPMKYILEAEKRKPVHSNVPIIAGLDVARYGNDRSCLIVRQGDIILHVKMWSKISTTQLTTEVITQIMEHNIQTIIVDGNGVGGGVVDQLKEQLGSIQVIDFSGSLGANDSRFLNARSETWSLMKDWIKESACLPKNVEMESQLSTIKYLINKSSKLQLESKDDLRKRGKPSPDIGDALSMTFYQGATYNTEDMVNKLYGGASSGWH